MLYENPLLFKNRSLTRLESFTQLHLGSHGTVVWSARHGRSVAQLCRSPLTMLGFPFFQFCALPCLLQNYCLKSNQGQSQWQRFLENCVLAHLQEGVPIDRSIERSIGRSIGRPIGWFVGRSHSCYISDMDSARRRRQISS